MPFPLLRIFMLKNSSSIRQIRHETFRSIHKSSASLQGPCGGGCEGPDRKLHMDPGCKIALVTNGIQGTGFAIANQLLKNGVKHVVITGDDVCEGRAAVHKLNSTYGKKKAMFIGSSVTCMVQYEEMFKTAKDTFGRIDIFVNSTNLFDEKKWENEVVTNVVGKIRGCLLAYKYMGTESGGHGGVVINVSSLAAMKPLHAAPMFTSTQTASLGLSRSFGHPIHTDRSGIRTVQLLSGVNQSECSKGSDKTAMTPYLVTEIAQHFAKAKKQSDDACGQAVAHLVKCGDNGSVWVVEGSRLFELTLPKWESYSTLAAQYI